MKHKVGELEGPYLDAAVAMALGRRDVEIRQFGSDMIATCQRKDKAVARRETDRVLFQPSTEWDDGGPIIERERIWLEPVWPEGPHGWRAECNKAGSTPRIGSTPLIAAMRAYVGSKFGDEVELP